MFGEHETACAKLGGCKASSRATALDFNVRAFLHEIRRTLPYVPPIPIEALRSLHKAQDYKGMVRLIKRAMNIEDVTFQVVWVPPGAANKGDHKDSPAWVELPVNMPFYGTKAFKELTIKMYFRQEFLEKAYDEAAVGIAHELSHVVLEFIRHPLRGCEKVVDLTAILLGFSKLFKSACYKEQRVGNTIEIHTLGYVSRTDVQLANQILAKEEQQSKPKIQPSLTARNTLVGAYVALVAAIILVSSVPAWRIWQLHQRLLAQQTAIERKVPQWLNRTTVLVGARVGITSLTRVYRVVEDIKSPVSFERELRRWVCANEQANVRDGATYKFEYRDLSDKFITEFAVGFCS